MIKIKKGVLTILFVTFLFMYFLTSNVEKPVETSIEYLSNLDFKNSNQGTISLWFELDKAMLPEGIKYVIFFSSDEVRGLNIRYNMFDSTIEAGLPIIKSDEVEIFGQKHNVVYTYDGLEQALYLDGRPIAEGPFSTSDKITGFAIKELKSQQKYADVLPGGLTIKDRALSADEVRTLYLGKII